MERNAKFIVGLALFALGALLIGLYAYEQSREYLKGPQIVILEPKNGVTVTESLIVVSGNAQNVAYITLNGDSIFVDSKGNFRQKLLLLSGYNILTINAKDKFGRKVEKTLELVYKESTKELLATSSPPSL